jgi:hypothetical protein
MSQRMKIGALQSALALASGCGDYVDMQTQLAEVFEVQCQQDNRQVQAFVDSVVKNGPAGSEAAVAFLSQVITLASAGQESAYKAAKQVVKDPSRRMPATANTRTRRPPGHGAGQGAPQFDLPGRHGPPKSTDYTGGMAFLGTFLARPLIFNSRSNS